MYIAMNESEKIKMRQSHFRNMMTVALADGELNENEKEIIILLAKRIGITPSEMSLVNQNPDRIEFYNPQSYSLKVEQLYDLVQIMLFDGEFNAKEYTACGMIAISLGLNTEVVDSIVRKILAKVNNDVPLNVVPEILKEFNYPNEANNISKGAEKLDIGKIQFVSDNHIRYENKHVVVGPNTDKLGNNYGANRGIKVEPNIQGGEGYSVTMYNFDGNHPVWGNNIQMASKRMRIISSTSDKIVLRGFGRDPMGASFEDYGLTIFHNGNEPTKLMLHLHDRNVDIEYFKSKNDTDSSPLPSGNLNEIIELTTKIQQSKDAFSLNALYKNYGNYNHPQIQFTFGISYLIQKDYEKARMCLIAGAKYGVKFPCSVYDDIMVDAVGECFSHLLVNFNNVDVDAGAKALGLAYVYISRCIELYPHRVYDSYRSRGLLFSILGTPAQYFVMDNAGIGVLVEPFIISDFYYAGTIEGSPHDEKFEEAARIHDSLDDISIAGKDADEYSLIEMTELGEKRHLALFKTVERKYKEGKYNMTIEELNSFSR
jgi:hypothetical protein